MKKMDTGKSQTEHEQSIDKDQALIQRRREKARARRARETSQERGERLNALRQRAAVRRAQETSQERGERLNAIRQRAASRRHKETSEARTRRLDAQNEATARRREQRSALFEQRRHRREQYLHNRGWANPENHALHDQDWAQEQLGAFHHYEGNLRHIHCNICQETWPITNERTAVQNYTCPRCKRDKKSCRLYSAENDMDPGTVPEQLKGLTEIEEMLIARAFPIMCVYRKHGGQRGYKGHVLNLPQDIQGFLNTLPANVSDIPIIIIRKGGAGT